MAGESRDSSGSSSSTSGPCACSGECSTPFKFNVHAPEFVPMSSPLTAVGYFSQFVQLSNAGGGIGLAADWSFFGEPEPTFFTAPDLAHVDVGGAAGGSVQPRGASLADIAHKIIKQVRRAKMINICPDFALHILFPSAALNFIRIHINIRFLCHGPWPVGIRSKYRKNYHIVMIKDSVVIFCYIKY